MFNKLVFTFNFSKLKSCNKATTSGKNTTSEEFNIEFKDNEDYNRYKIISKLKDYWTRGKKKNG